MVADNTKRCSLVRQRMRLMSAIGPTNRTGKVASPAGATIGIVPEMGAGFCRSVQTTSNENRQPVRYRGDGLLHQMGGSQITTGRYGCPIELVSDQGGHFLGQVVESLTTFYAVVHKRSTLYYPQANGLAKSTNKTLQNILRKIVNENRTDWDTKLHSAL